jgi:hypothetical protein
VVTAPDAARSRSRWARFVPVALAADFGSVHAIPIKVRDHVIGALNLFGADTGSLDAADQVAASSLATATAITLLRQRDLAEAEAGHLLEPAGGDRLVVEQARGVLAGQADVTLGEALTRLHRYANYHNLPLNSVCEQVVAGTLSLVTSAEITKRERRHRGT